MGVEPLSQISDWADLKRQAESISQPDRHLKFLIKEHDRLQTFSRKGAGLFFDFSRQRLDLETLKLLLRLAETRKLTTQFAAMVSGKKVNHTESRAALHTAARSFSADPLLVEGVDVMPDIRRVRKEIDVFSKQIHSGQITGAAAKPFTDAVVIGIGGSYLGTEFVARALNAVADRGIRLHFLSNVDIHNFGAIAGAIDPDSTLWIVISKSYTTPETKANEHQVRIFLTSRGLDPAKHIVTVTSKGSPGDDAAHPVLATFHMFDFIGGRYSVTSAVGGVPLSLYLGYERFKRFLKGAEEMDRHAAEAPAERNLPLLAALISIWNNNFLGYSTQAIIPYASPLSKLAPHIQQLSMESNGKSATQDGRLLKESTGVIIFGEPGTNAQHSFFQLAHQGRPFPIDFIGVLTPQYKQYGEKTNGVTNHQELWANLISQPKALATGNEGEDRARYFSGNRPSSTIIMEDLSPENIGRLLSFYEAKTVFEAFIWGINPFDQFGVELGKVLAGDIRKQMVQKNEKADADFAAADPITRFYLEALFRSKI